VCTPFANHPGRRSNAAAERGFAAVFRYVTRAVQLPEASLVALSDAASKDRRAAAAFERRDVFPA
jgi:hypothetical protein